MIILTFSLLILSLIGLAVLIKLRDDLGESLLDILGRLDFAVFGTSILLLGITFYQRSWPLAAFISPICIVLGLQIALWAIGISSEWLANTSHLAFGHQPQSDKSMLWYGVGSRDEIQIRDMREREIEARIAYEEIEIKARIAYEERELRLRQNTLQLEQINTQIFQLQEERQRGGIHYKLYNHLLSAIGILKFVRENRDLTKTEEIHKAFEADIEQIVKILQTGVPFSGKGSVKPLIENLAVLRFGSFERAMETLDSLETIAVKLEPELSFQS